MKSWWTWPELAGLPGMPGESATLKMGQSGRFQRQKRAIGKGWEYHLDSLPQETQAHLRAQANEPAAPITDSSSPGTWDPGLSAAPCRADGPSYSSASAPAPASTQAAIIRGPWAARAQSTPTPEPTTPPAPDTIEDDEAPVIATGLLPTEPAALPGIDALQAYASSRALRLSLKDLQDPRVQVQVRVAHALENAPWGERETTINRLAEQYQVSGVTIRRWSDQVSQWRVASRVPSVQMLDTAIDLPRAKSFDEAAIRRGIEIYAGSMRCGMLAAYNALTVEAGTAGWRLGDYTSFTRLMRKVPDRFWEYIRKGETGFELGVTPKIVRAWLSVPAYSVLCGDQNIPDYLVVEPGTGEVYTPELYLWMDCTSRAWVGLWPAWGHYSRYTLGMSLREASRIATPGEVFTDWGKPETSKYSAQLVAGLNGYCGVGDWSDYAGRYSARDAMSDGDRDEVTHRKTTRVGIPWQKPIEPQMAVLKRAYLNRFTPGMRQRLPGAWENDERAAELKRARANGTLLTTEEFLELTRDIAISHNQTAFKARETPTPIVPMDVLTRGLREAPRTVFDDLTLDLLFLPRFVRAPNQSLVRIQVGPGDLRHYYAAELSRLGKGERVQVSVDPFDAERPAVLTTLNGDYLALAEPWKVQQPDDAKGLAWKIARQMELMKWWRKEVRALRGDSSAMPRIAAVTKTAKAAAAAETAKPDKGAAKRADQALIERFGGGQR